MPHHKYILHPPFFPLRFLSSIAGFSGFLNLRSRNLHPEPVFFGKNIAFLLGVRYNKERLD